MFWSWQIVRPYREATGKQNGCRSKTRLETKTSGCILHIGFSKAKIIEIIILALLYHNIPCSFSCKTLSKLEILTPTPTSTNASSLSMLLWCKSPWTPLLRVSTSNFSDAVMCSLSLCTSFLKNDACLEHNENVLSPYLRTKTQGQSPRQLPQFLLSLAILLSS